MPTPPAEPFTRRAAGYPGRDRLDAANMRFRRAVARLHREGVRHQDAETAAKVGPIVARAEAVLRELAAEAEQAADNSARHLAALAKEEAKLARLERRLGRRIGGEPPRV